MANNHQKHHDRQHHDRLMRRAALHGGESCKKIKFFAAEGTFDIPEDSCVEENPAFLEHLQQRPGCLVFTALDRPAYCFAANAIAEENSIVSTNTIETITTSDSGSSLCENNISLSLSPARDGTKKESPSKDQRKKRSILILGANGRTGIECIRHFAKSQDSPQIHGFCRDIRNMSDENMEVCKQCCEHLIIGNATDAADLYRALRITQADTVVICIGGNSKNKYQKPVENKPVMVRTSSAKALVKVLVHPPFHHVRVICISSAVVSGFSMPSSSGIGCLLPALVPLSTITNSSPAGCILPSAGNRCAQHDLHDHIGQEDAFYINKTIRDRTTIVRPTILSSDRPTGSKTSKTNKRRLVTYKSENKPPSNKTDRRDLARWLVTETFYHVYEGRSINVTSV